MSVELSIGTTPNYATLTIGTLRLEFSYSTVIAFRDGDDSAVRENVWGPTTGKHLNRVDGGGQEARKRRIPGDEFERRLDAALERHGLND